MASTNKFSTLAYRSGTSFVASSFAPPSDRACLHARAHASDVCVTKCHVLGVERKRRQGKASRERAPAFSAFFRSSLPPLLLAQNLPAYWHYLASPTLNQTGCLVSPSSAPHTHQQRGGGGYLEDGMVYQNLVEVFHSKTLPIRKVFKDMLDKSCLELYFSSFASCH